MNWVDVALVALVAGAALHGWRTGAVVQLFGFGGFWLGLALGVLAAAPLARLLSGTTRAVVTLVVVFAGAALLGTLGRLLGAHLGRALRTARLGTADAASGVAVATLATLALSWLVGSILAVGLDGGLGRAIAGSRVVRALDRALPPVPALFAQVESFLSASGMPIVFVDLPPGLVAPARLPGAAAVLEAVGVARPAVLEVRGTACGALRTGSGFVVAPGVVVTSAHVIAGVGHAEVRDQTGTHGAAVIGFDPKLDVAVLRVPGLADPALAVHDGLVGRGTTAVALGYPGGGAFAYAPAAVNAAFLAVGLDIYGTGLATRDVYELHAAVLSGDSGGPLVAAGGGAVANGTVVGLVFARSLTTGAVGYALAMPAVVAATRAARAAGGPVSTGACLP